MLHLATHAHFPPFPQRLLPLPRPPKVGFSPTHSGEEANFQASNYHSRVLYLVPVAALAIVGVIVFLNERYGLLAADRFPTTAHRIGAYAWLALFAGGISSIVVFSAMHPVTPSQMKEMPFAGLFLMHILLITFLFGWWLLAGRPPVSEFLSIRRNDRGEAVMVGLSVGFGGWLFTIAAALALALVLRAAGLIGQDVQPSPMIPWMVRLAVWKKLLVVFMAMTVEEAFFRGWLQKRVGLVLSTIAFAVAHAGYGQPFLLVGVGIISMVIGVAFYRTKNLIPCIIAHGVFDGIQLFVIVPLAMKMIGG
jgi:membrane protease YdiL (CAAX protease family)